MATDIKQQALEKHYEWQGKIEVISRAPVNTREDLARLKLFLAIGILFS